MCRECFLSPSSSCSHSAKLIEKKKKLFWIGLVLFFFLKKKHVHLPYFISRFKEGERSGSSSVKSVVSSRLKGLMLLLLFFFLPVHAFVFAWVQMTQMETKRTTSFYPQFYQHLSFKLTLQTGFEWAQKSSSMKQQKCFSRVWSSHLHFSSFQKNVQFINHQSSRNKIMTVASFPLQSHTEHICINPIISLEVTLRKRQKILQHATSQSHLLC